MNPAADRRAILVYLLVTWTASSLFYFLIIKSSPGTAGTMTLTMVGAPATHALLDRLEDHLNGRAPADMPNWSADARSLNG